MAELISAGLMMYTFRDKKLKIFLVHPGGPFFVKKDEGYWGIPKGLVEKGEDLFETAKREFEEETGIIPEGKFISLGFVTQKSGKKVYGWAYEVPNDMPVEITCNTFEMEWPPHSGKKQSFPEVDRGEFFNIQNAMNKINAAQIEFINRLKEHLQN
ncbi:MAG: NUDIX domain-containing protein [Ignavibacteriaceae bacterium]